MKNTRSMSTANCSHPSNDRIMKRGFAIITTVFPVLLLAFLLSCNGLKNRNREEPIARVNDKMLLPSDIVGIFPAGLSEEDSLMVLRNFINKWIKQKLILQKAELNLTEEQKDVRRQLDEYRSSLLIYKYEQNLIKQKLDTVIDEKEVEDYYNENTSNFILEDIIVKALFIKLPADAPNINSIRYIYRSQKEEDIQQIESYCYQFAVKYDDFDDRWVELGEILNELPGEIANPVRRLRYYDYIEQEDSLYRYFVHIRDYKLNSELAPLDYVSDNIRSIIMNKRKLQFIQDLENNIYNDAQNRGQFTIYQE